MKIGLLGVFAIVILISVCSILIAYWLNGLKTRYSLAKQIIIGFSKFILPLILMFAIFYGFEDKLNSIDIDKVVSWFNNVKLSIKEIKESFYVIIPCEIISVVINPLPKWCFDNNVDGLVGIVNKIKGE